MHETEIEQEQTEKGESDLSRRVGDASPVIAAVGIRTNSASDKIATE